METMKAVPTPRLEVGEKALAAQLLCKWRQFHFHKGDRQNLHDQREQAIISTNDQEQRKVRCTHTLLHRSGKDYISNKRDGTRGHNVIASVSSVIAVQRLE